MSCFAVCSDHAGVSSMLLPTFNGWQGGQLHILPVSEREPLSNQSAMKNYERFARLTVKFFIYLPTAIA